MFRLATGTARGIRSYFKGMCNATLETAEEGHEMMLQNSILHSGHNKAFPSQFWSRNAFPALEGAATLGTAIQSVHVYASDISHCP